MQRLIQISNTKIVDPRRGGYSDVRMWPGYIVYCLSIAGLTPFLGVAWSIALVTVIVIGGAVSIRIMTKHHTIYKSVDEILAQRESAKAQRRASAAARRARPTKRRAATAASRLYTAKA